MVIKVEIVPSLNATKKFEARIKVDTPKKRINRTIQFGSKGMSDFTRHKDPERKQRYLDRHRPRENWEDPLTAGFFSRWVLWNKTSLEASKREAIKKAETILKNKYGR